MGEHHRADFAVSSPEVVLATIAGRTSRIRLGSAVTVLSSDDPVRVFHRFATLDVASNGRAEIILGRGAFTESFPLFGFPLDQYQTLFEERLELLAAILDADRAGTPVTWRGTTRAPLTNPRVYPTSAGTVTTWIGVGGSPESVVRAAKYRMPLTLAIVEGSPLRFAPYIDPYPRRWTTSALPRSLSACTRAGTSPNPMRRRTRRAGSRGARCATTSAPSAGGRPPSRADFEREAEHGSLYVGAPDTVARRIATTVRALGLSRFDIKYSAGAFAHDTRMRSIGLLGREVMPRVRALVEASQAAEPSASGRA